MSESNEYRRSFNQYYKVIPLEGNLDPREILKLRTKHYKNIFFRNQLYDQIIEKINSSSLTFITGNPLAGKTRVVYEAIKGITDRTLLCPISEKFDKYPFPSTGSRYIVFIDEIDQYCKNCPAAINKLLYFVLENNIPTIVTCRTGPEYKNMQYRIKTDILIELSSNHIHINRIDPQDSNFSVFAKYNISKIELSDFDGNIGSLFMPLRAMKERYDSLVMNKLYIPVLILKALKFHYHLFNYEMNKNTYSEYKIKYFCEKYLESKITTKEWYEGKKVLMSTYTDLNFIDQDEDTIIIEEAYLDIHQKPGLDVIEESYSLTEIKKLYRDLYTNIYDNISLGFPTRIKDWNRIIDKESDFDNAYKVFTLLPKKVRPDKITYTLLMKKTSDWDKLKHLFFEMRKQFDTRHIANSVFYRNAKDFIELHDVIKSTIPDHLYYITSVSELLMKKAKLDSALALNFIFTNYSLEEVYSNHVFSQICLNCCQSESDYKMFVEPFVLQAPLLDNKLFKNFVRLCCKLKQYEIALTFIDTYFKEDIVFYNNEKGNCLKDSDPYHALELYEKAEDYSTIDDELLKTVINYCTVVYEKQIDEFIDSALKKCYKIQKLDILKLRSYHHYRNIFLLISLKKAYHKNITKTIDDLLNVPGITPNSFIKIYERIDDPVKRDIVFNYISGILDARNNLS